METLLGKLETGFAYPRHLWNASGAPRVAQQLGIARSVELAEPVDPMAVPTQSAAEISQDNTQLLLRGSGLSGLPVEWNNQTYHTWASHRLDTIDNICSAPLVKPSKLTIYWDFVYIYIYILYYIYIFLVMNTFDTLV